MKTAKTTTESALQVSMKHEQIASTSNDVISTSAEQVMERLEDGGEIQLDVGLAYYLLSLLLVFVLFYFILYFFCTKYSLLF